MKRITLSIAFASLALAGSSALARQADVCACVDCSCAEARSTLSISAEGSVEIDPDRARRGRPEGCSQRGRLVRLEQVQSTGAADDAHTCTRHAQPPCRFSDRLLQ